MIILPKTTNRNLIRRSAISLLTLSSVFQFLTGKTLSKIFTFHEENKKFLRKRVNVRKMNDY